MNSDVLKIRLFCTILMSLCCSAGCSAASSERAPTAPGKAPFLKGPFDEYAQPGVVMVALIDPNENDETETIAEARRRSTGEEQAESGERKLFKIQLDIVEKVAATGSDFFMFVNSADVRQAVYLQCAGHQSLCDGLRAGRGRIIQLPFEGPWIRDYGPQFVFDGPNRIKVNDARYHDVRWEQSIEDQIDAIDKARISLAKQRQSELKWSQWTRRRDGWEDSGADDDNDDDDVDESVVRARLSVKSQSARPTTAEQKKRDLARQKEVVAAKERRREEAARKRREALEERRRAEERDQREADETLTGCGRMRVWKEEQAERADC